ncbi:MAG: histidine triad nucleotide-binding protein [Deltaproteobacteria bacterium]|nr:histidine triad nucleotide-binding protein [Deltaproteobacteria bacterium]
MLMTDCIFCKIVAGQIPAQVVWQDENAMAFRDIHPKAPVHVIFIPKRHADGWGDLDDAPFLASLGAGIRAVAEREGVAATGYRILSNNGEDGGQEVMHLHVHLVGGKPLGPMLLQR